MKCCIEIKYCLGVAITTKRDGFFMEAFHVPNYLTGVVGSKIEEYYTK
ncbi:hypothetical protein [Limosilactobacillus reuteri]